jgi:H+-transporting ATPase
MFVYLIYSAQVTIYMTRVRDHFWSFAPSRYVMAVTIANIIAASALAFWGIMMAAVPVVLLIGTLGAVLAVAFLLDEVKIWFFRKTGILGGSSQTLKA